MKETKRRRKSRRQRTKGLKIKCNRKVKKKGINKGKTAQKQRRKKID